MSVMSPKVAFVIVGWNNQALLKDCFDSINDQSHKDIITIYVDNNSSDGSADWVREHNPGAIILDQETNTGFAKANNIGIQKALEDPGVGFVALLNTDARLHADWTRALVNFASQKPKGAFYQGTTLDYYNHGIIDSTHIFTARNGQGTQGNWRRYLTHEIGPKKVFGTNAAACMISRAFIEKQPFGGKLFDETMFMYLEDVDAVTRATVMGWDNYLVPGARAYHMGSVSSGKNPGFSLYMTFRNNSGMLFKNFPIRLLLKMLPKLIRGDIDTLRTLKRLNKKGARAIVIKGRLVGILRLPIFIPSRIKLSRYRKIDTDYLWDLMNKGF